MGIRTKLILLLCTVTAGTIVVLTGFLYAIGHSRLKSVSLAALEALAEYEEEHINDSLSEYLAQAGLVAGTGIRSRLIEYRQSGSEEAVNQMRRILVRALDSNLSFTRFELVDAEGREVITAGQSRSAIAEAIEHGRSLPQEGIRLARLGDGLFAVGSLPLRSEQDLLGYLRFELRADQIERLLQAHNGLGVSGEKVLVTRRSDGALHVLAPPGVEPGSDVRLEANSAVAAVRAAMGEEGTFGAGSLEFHDYRDTPVIAVTRYLPEFDIGLVVKIEKAEMLEPVRGLLRQMLQLAALVLFVAAAMGYLVGSRFVAPILSLVTALQEARESGFAGTHVSVDSTDEVGELANAFNQLWDELDQTLVSREALREEIEVRREAERQLAEASLQLQRLNRSLEERVRIRTEELARSNFELEQFAGIAAHDLQEPLRKIEAFSERLTTKCMSQLDDRGRDYLARIENSVRRMRGLIDDLLRYSRVHRKAQPFIEVNLNLLVREVLQDLEHRVQETSAAIEIEPLPTIQADRTQMKQLFQNLIGNSLKYRREGVAPEISIRAQEPEPVEREAGERPGLVYELQIEDNGIGFEQKYAERIFRPFERLHGRGKYEGTGMGLAICKRIVERHGGTIVARPSAAGGACFAVRLLSMQENVDEVLHEHV